MRFAQILSGGFAAVTLGLIIHHFVNLPARSIGGWIEAPRYSKSASFDVADIPSDVTDYSWTSLWGRNRPKTGAPHEILSELEVIVQHETRSGLVILRVSGDTEAEVDGFIETIRRDFERTYRQSTSINDPMSRSHFHSSSEVSETVFYWRQKYLWLLGTGFIISSLVTFLSVGKKNKQNKSEQATPRKPSD